MKHRVTLDIDQPCPAWPPPVGARLEMRWAYDVPGIHGTEAEAVATVTRVEPVAPPLEPYR